MRVLVIEDDDDLRSQVVTALQQAGFTVDDAANGEDGQHSAKRRTMPQSC